MSLILETVFPETAEESLMILAVISEPMACILMLHLTPGLCYGMVCEFRHCCGEELRVCSHYMNLSDARLLRSCYCLTVSFHRTHLPLVRKTGGGTSIFYTVVASCQFFQDTRRTVLISS